jgi:phosphate/sulfate permease
MNWKKFFELAGALFVSVVVYDFILKPYLDSVPISLIMFALVALCVAAIWQLVARIIKRNT